MIVIKNYRVGTGRLMTIIFVHISISDSYPKVSIVLKVFIEKKKPICIAQRACFRIRKRFDKNRDICPYPIFGFGTYLIKSYPVFGNSKFILKRGTWILATP